MISLPRLDDGTLNGRRFSFPFFFVGRAWLFQPLFFSFSPIIIFHYSLISPSTSLSTSLISLSVEGHGIAVAPWRLASTIITIIILLHLSIYSSSSSTSSSLYIRYFFLTLHPINIIFLLHQHITPPPPFDASASI